MPQEALRTTLNTKKIQQLYDFISIIYNHLTYFERKIKRHALEIITIKKGFVILEVGFGTGKILNELVQKTGDTGKVFGLDISLKMIKKAKGLAIAYDTYQRMNLIAGDGAKAPFHNSLFDVIFSSYLFDLIDTPEIPQVLSEFKRLLKPGGSVVIVNLSRGCKWYNNMKLYEWMYKRFPLLLGGCRPIFLKSFLKQLNFIDIDQKFLYAGLVIPNEIIIAKKALNHLQYIHKLVLTKNVYTA